MPLPLALGIGIPLAGAALSGFGGMQANWNNKDTKARMGHQVASLKSLAQPLGESLMSGAAPGGFLRRQMVAGQVAPAAERYGKNLGSVRSNAWRFGGAGSPLAVRMEDDAETQAGFGYAGGQMQGELQATDLMSRMNTLMRGYTDAFKPSTVYSNPYAWVGQAASGFGRGFSQAYGGEY